MSVRGYFVRGDIDAPLALIWGLGMAGVQPFHVFVVVDGEKSIMDTFR